MGRLQEKVMLVKIRMGMWGAYKSDKAATEAVQMQFSAFSGSGNYSKKLTGKGDLTAINSVKEEVENFVRKQTLPWEDSGWRVLPNASYMEFVTKLRNLKASFQEAVSEVMRNYDIIKDNAKARLGDLYNDKDYPEPWELERKFYFSANFMPMPDSSNFILEIGEEEKAYLVEQARHTEQQMLQNVTRECYQRIYDSLSGLYERLLASDNRWRESTLESLSGIVEIMPRLNISNDPELTRMTGIIAEKICKHGEVNLKYSPAARHEAVGAATPILDNLRSYLGV